MPWLIIREQALSQPTSCGAARVEGFSFICFTALAFGGGPQPTPGFATVFRHLPATSPD